MSVENSFAYLYLRLSRDDGTNQSVSIENQNEMLTKYAIKHNYIVKETFIDDGFSGYSFDRPAFKKMKEKIKSKEIKTLLVKDLSRLGRNNPRVLLFIEECRDNGTELIFVDDNYSNMNEENDYIIGVKTWHNELYVKESRKKVKAVIKMKQEDGEWNVNVPYGYKKIPFKKFQYVLDDTAALVVKKIYNMYLNGTSMIRIANNLTEDGIPTPSMHLKNTRECVGTIDTHKVSYRWSSKTISDILSNEFYTGTCIQGKGECLSIRGKYIRKEEKEWKKFVNRHEAIISIELYEKVKDIRIRKRTHREIERRKYNSLLHGLLYCGECGKKMTPIKYKSDYENNTVHYICSEYKHFGKDKCVINSITEDQIIGALRKYLEKCRNIFAEYIHTLDKEIKVNHISYKNNLNEFDRMKNKEDQLEKEIKTLIDQRIKDCVANPERIDNINNFYQQLMNEKYDDLERCHSSLLIMQKDIESPEEHKEEVKTCIRIFDRLLEKENIDRAIIEILIEKIIIYDKKGIDFYMNGNLSTILNPYAEIEYDDEHLYSSMLINEVSNNDKFQLKPVYEQLCIKGYPYSYKTFVKLVNALENKGILERGKVNRPSRLIMDKEKALQVAGCLPLTTPSHVGVKFCGST